ncbi:MarR family winged helix-turn-helix transcriptional regulator [Paracoccus salipaludis]|nr:MarR family transcriptional regulator [Paracoccus salipaludis]
MTDPTLRTMPGHLIRRLHQLSTQVFAAAMAQAGEDLTPVQFAMMDALAAEPGLDQASLARAIGKDRATVGAVAERLAKKGLIARTASAHDRRAIELELTGAGRDLHARLAPRVAAIQADILPGLSEAERATFVALVARALAAAGD